MIIKKTDKAIWFYRTGKIKDALKIAKTFRIGITKEEHDKMVRAYECMVHPEFYKMIGKNPEEEIRKGIAIFKEKILKGEVA